MSVSRRLFFRIGSAGVGSLYLSGCVSVPKTSGTEAQPSTTAPTDTPALPSMRSAPERVPTLQDQDGARQAFSRHFDRAPAQSVAPQDPTAATSAAPAHIRNALSSSGEQLDEALRRFAAQWPTLRPPQRQSAMIRALGRPLALHMADIAKLVALPASMLATNGRATAAAAPSGGQFAADLVVPAGASASFSIQGFCLDSKVGAPNRGDQLHLVPSSSTIPTPLLAVYEGLGHWARNNARQEQLIQSAYWALAHAGTNNPYARPAAQTQRVLNEAYPGGAAIQASYHASESLKSQVLDALLRQAGVDRLPGMDALLRGDVATATQQLMNQRIAEGQRIAGPKGHGYSWLAPGVAARATGNGPLGVDIQVLNTTAQPFRFVPANYIAQPVARMQPVGLPARIAAAAGSAGGRALTATEQWLGAIQASLGTLGRSLQDFFARPLFAGAFDWTVERPRFDISTDRLLALVREGDRRFMLKTAVDASPVLGNLLSLHEAVSGTDWLYGQPLHPVERTMLFAAALPGANAIWKSYTTMGRLVDSGAIALSPGAKAYVGRAVDTLGEFAAGGGTAGFMREALYMPARQVGEFSRTQGNLDRRAANAPEPSSTLVDPATNVWSWIGNDATGQFTASPAQRAIMRELAPHWGRASGLSQ